MALEDFTTYTKVDPNSKFSVSANSITYTGLLNSESAYIYKDAGINHFAADFTHLVDAIYTSAAGASTLVGNWAITNDIGTLDVIEGAGKSALYAFLYTVVGVSRNIYIKENDNGTKYSTSYPDSAPPQNRYFKIIRNESVGTYGTIYLYIYSDADRTNLLSTLSIALHTSKKDYRYVYAVQSDYYPSFTGNTTGYMNNLDLGEAVTTNSGFFAIF